MLIKKKDTHNCVTPSGTRTHSLLVRSQTPCPFGHKGESKHKLDNLPLNLCLHTNKIVI